MGAVPPTDQLDRTPLHDLHVEWGGRMVGFAGFAMPVQYPSGILAEHRHCRTAAALFDVSHMGQAKLSADGDPAVPFETLVPGDLRTLKPGRMRYTLLLNDAGGIRDDLMVTRLADNRLFVVVNAACRDADFAHIASSLDGSARLEISDDRALLALQGPQAAAVMARLCPAAAALTFMSGTNARICGADAFITRSGYTGEDGFEISLAADAAAAVARALVAEPEVAPVGLGARDSLRLEAGLCLYGQDIDQTTTPVEAGLAWTIGKRRRATGDFPGAEIILRQLAEGPARKRVGIRPDGRAPARAGAIITDEHGAEIGRVTSGGFGATVGGPVAMGYVAVAHGEPGTSIQLVVRDRPMAARVVSLPFVAPNYHRG